MVRKGNTNKGNKIDYKHRKWLGTEIQTKGIKLLLFSKEHKKNIRNYYTSLPVSEGMATVKDVIISSIKMIFTLKTSLLTSSFSLILDKFSSIEMTCSRYISANLWA